MTLIAASRPEPESILPVLDPATLEELEELAEDGAPGFLEELFQSFLESCETTLRALERAVRDGDSRDVAREAHTMKGAAGAVGALALARICLDLQRSGEEGDRSAFAAALGSAQVEIHRVRNALLDRMPELQR